MRYHVVAAVSQTRWFVAGLALALLAGARRRSETGLSPRLSEGLKGFAILAVVFSHIGYFLVDDDRFLFPLTILAGVAVNLFLFLSGYGLAVGMGARPLTPGAFYRKRLGRLLLPLWIVLAVGLILDRLWIGRAYGTAEILLGFAGIFPVSDLAGGFNAPLWYLTFILGWYALFPWVFRRERPFRSALALAAAGLALTALPLPVDENVAHLYRLHTLAFPLGVAAVGFASRWRDGFGKEAATIWNALAPGARRVAAWAAAIGMGALTGYLALHGNVGRGIWPEQLASLATMLGVLGLFLLNPWESRLLNATGAISYELYLVHWPLLARFIPPDPRLPAALWTGLALAAAAGVSVAIRLLAKRLESIGNRQST